MATPWSLGLRDLDTLEMRRQLARLPSKTFHLICEGLRMDRISAVTPVQEICRTLWRPAPHYSTPQDHSSFDSARCAKRPFGCSAGWTRILSGTDCGVIELSLIHI